MRRAVLFLVTVFLLMTASISWAQEIMTHEVKGFPLGVGKSVEEIFLKPHYPIFQAMADTVIADTNLMLVLIGTADANQYHENDDAKNPGLAYGRAGKMANIFESLGVPADRIRIVGRESDQKGGNQRKVAIQVMFLSSGTADVDLSTYVTHDELCDELENLPTSEVTHNHFLQVFSLVEVGAGITTSPFGKLLVNAHGRIGNPTLSLEIEVGHSLTTKDILIQESETRIDFQMIGGHALFNLWQKIYFAGGWERCEERSRFYGRYTTKKEGYSFGLRWYLGNYFSISGYYLRVERDDYLHDNVIWTNEFRFGISVNKIWRKK